jgi:hypothetical protein
MGTVRLWAGVFQPIFNTPLSKQTNKQKTKKAKNKKTNKNKQTNKQQTMPPFLHKFCQLSPPKSILYFRA